MVAKQALLEVIREMPDGDIDVDEMLHEVEIREKIARGEADYAAGRVSTTDEVKQRLARWLE